MPAQVNAGDARRNLGLQVGHFIVHREGRAARQQVLRGVAPVHLTGVSGVMPSGRSTNKGRHMNGPVAVEWMNNATSDMAHLIYLHQRSRSEINTTNLHQASRIESMRRTSFADMNCSIARALDLIGEWWTLLIVREPSWAASVLASSKRAWASRPMC